MRFLPFLGQKCILIHCIAQHRMILHGIELYQYGIALFLMVLHWYCMVLHGIARCCIVLYGITLYRIKSYGIATYCIVGFGARAVSRKTPIYFICKVNGMVIFYSLVAMAFIFGFSINQHQPVSANITQHQSASSASNDNNCNL